MELVLEGSLLNRVMSQAQLTTFMGLGHAHRLCPSLMVRSGRAFKRSCEGKPVCLELTGV